MILIVEDNGLIAELFATALRDVGYSVDVAARGAEALALLQRGVYDLALVDLSLPDMNGAELVTAARQAGVTAPMVAVSGAASLIAAERLHSAGFIGDPISKPVRLSVLVGLAMQFAGPPPAQREPHR